MGRSPATVVLQLPSILEPVAGTSRLEIRGHSIAEALDCAFDTVPLLRHHLALESGQLRPHVLCVLNGTVVDRDKIDEIALENGDEILIHQAISGG